MLKGLLARQFRRRLISFAPLGSAESHFPRNGQVLFLCLGEFRLSWVGCEEAHGVHETFYLGTNHVLELYPAREDPFIILLVLSGRCPGSLIFFLTVEARPLLLVEDHLQVVAQTQPMTLLKAALHKRYFRKALSKELSCHVPEDFFLIHLKTHQFLLLLILQVLAQWLETHETNMVDVFKRSELGYLLFQDLPLALIFYLETDRIGQLGLLLHDVDSTVHNHNLQFFVIKFFPLFFSHGRRFT